MQEWIKENIATCEAREQKLDYIYRNNSYVIC